MARAVNAPEAGRFCLTVDVEDWAQSTWDRSLPITERALANTHAMLALLAGFPVRATFFVLGKFAETFPQAVGAIQAAGHEVACHGYGHVEIVRQDRETFREDLRRARGLLEDALGAPVEGYRAPDFSVVRESLWALDVIAEEGFRYDSSVFPIARGRYGISGWPLSPVRVPAAGRELVEASIAAAVVFGRRWPVGGGGYARILPGAALTRAVAHVLAAGRDFVFYCHPYELDPDGFRELELPIPWRTRLHQGLGRGGFRRKLLDLLRAYGSTALGERLSDVERFDVYRPGY